MFPFSGSPLHGWKSLSTPKLSLVVSLHHNPNSGDLQCLFTGTVYLFSGSHWWCPVHCWLIYGWNISVHHLRLSRTVPVFPIVAVQTLFYLGIFSAFTFILISSLLNGGTFLIVHKKTCRNASKHCERCSYINEPHKTVIWIVVWTSEPLQRTSVHLSFLPSWCEGGRGDNCCIPWCAHSIPISLVIGLHTPWEDMQSSGHLVPQTFFHE